MATSLPDIPVDSALTRLFQQPRARAETAWFSLLGGQKLFGQGDPSDRLFVLRTGRLGAFRREEGQEPHFLGVIRPGEPAGEMALIAGAAHSADVYALRDSEIFSLPRDVFFEACETDPAVMTELARLMIRRTRQTSASRGPVGEPSVFGFVPAGHPGKIRPLVERIAMEIIALGYEATTVGVEAAAAPSDWFSEVERTHDFVLYVAEREDHAWAPFVPRQVDRLFQVGRGDKPPVHGRPPGAATLQEQGLVDLILLQPDGIVRPSGSEGWLDATGAPRVFHVRHEHGPDYARIARVLTGQSVGLVLSGGGARAYAHVGAIRALHERNVPIDFVGGSSMGAIVGAGVAMGWDDAELDRRLRQAFVDSSPLDDIALPLLAMTHGQKVTDRLGIHYGETQIADLWLPFFCLSSNLTTGAYQLHRRGLLRKALRASISLPGVMPPATDGSNVLVDGAVMKNFPADVMRSAQLGPIVGVDVTAARSITAADVAEPESIWRWLRSGRWRLGPPIVSLLMRSATVSTGRDLVAAREATDILIQPEVSNIEIRDWRAYDQAVAEGYRSAIAALDKLKRPVVDLRRRQSLRELAQAGAPSGPSFMAGVHTAAE